MQQDRQAALELDYALVQSRLPLPQFAILVPGRVEGPVRAESVPERERFAEKNEAGDAEDQQSTPDAAPCARRARCIAGRSACRCEDDKEQGNRPFRTAGPQ
jgi:hypothetical protein